MSIVAWRPHPEGKSQSSAINVPARSLYSLVGIMQTRYSGGVGDFGKFALLRHLMQGRRLAVCWYLTGANDHTTNHDRYFDYLTRPLAFRHLAPELYDQLVEFLRNRDALADPLAALQSSGVLEDAIFIRREVPKKASSRLLWAEGLVNSVRGANLVFLDPDNGIEGRRLTKRHAALAEIAALRQKDRALIIGHHQSGRKAEVKYLADQMKSLGCDIVEIVRLRLVTSCLYVIVDPDSTMTELAATFVRRWGSLARFYQF
ncbi:MAG TPA: hypothetical protein VKC66_38175 [Xanthobacteraceae bacterium]|nr:hypothetical protein [Xanthobacteraceae bacterium]